jgi:aspartate/tyrosine/aromatic aminotransferase
VCIQALSGTGALRVGAAFVGKFMKGTKVFISNPTWGEEQGGEEGGGRAREAAAAVELGCRWLKVRRA